MAFEEVKSFKTRQQRRRDRRLGGSRKGYSADIDDASVCLAEDEVPATNAATNGRTCFYSHVQPKRRYKNKKRMRDGGTRRHLSATDCPRSHPDIDLSMVSLLSPKELDRRFTSSHRRDSNFSSSSAGASPSTSGTSSDSDGIIKKCKKQKRLSSRPLAVVDYGSIELDMSGSLLDSIYKIGGSDNKGSKDILIGGRRYSNETNDTSDANREYMTMDGSRVDISTISSCAPMLESACMVASNRSPEVNAVIASLKKIPSARDTSAFSYDLDGPGMKQKNIARASRTRFPAIEEFQTTMENSLSFSPYARLLFCAQPPYTVVYQNAAYQTLMQNGMTKSCIVGNSLASNGPCKGETLEEFIPRIVSQHIGTPEREETICVGASSRLGKFVGMCHTRIFPVISNDDACSQFARGYSHNNGRILHGMGGGDKSETMCDRDDVPSPSAVKPKSNQNESTQYLSHYLIQIKPRPQEERSNHAQCLYSGLTTDHLAM